MPRALSAWLLLAMVGCDSLSEFSGDFDGNVVTGTFVRSCFDNDARAVLKFDPARAVGSNEGVPADERNRLTIEGVFDDTELEPVSLLSNDTLADFDFPGPKRLKSYLLLARPTQGPLAGRDAMVVVSLLDNKNKGIELRVIGRGEVTDEPCPGEIFPEAGVTDTRAREYFGLFRLGPTD